LRPLCPGITPALADLVDQALKYDVVLRMADAAEFKQRLMAIKSGVSPATIPQRNSSTGPAARPQLKLPRGGVRSGEQHASAPTMLSNQIHTECPRCGRNIPVDSNYCSFCAADVTGRLSAPDRGAHEAQTIVLDDVAAPGGYPGPIFHPHARRRHRARTLALVTGGFFLIGYLMFHSPQPQPSDGDSGPDYGAVPGAPNGGAPDASEPVHTEPREIALRRMLNAQGYSSVHFRMEGDTIVLWGMVPTEADRLIVQTQVFMFARISSIEDHIQVRYTFAAP
jgi:ribosomal protein L37E